MIKNLVTALFGTRYERDRKKLEPILAAIKQHEQRLAALDDDALRGQTAKFRALIAERTAAAKHALDEARQAKLHSAEPGTRDVLEARASALEVAWKQALAATLDELLPEAYATVREACRRLKGSTVTVTGHDQTWDMVPYDVQLIGGTVLHQGRIAEMATGEGKTLVATLPVYLNALTGRGVHVVTVNNYLARRDSQWMGHLYRWLGLTVGCLDDTEPSSPERRAAYECDITYGTNNEFGFDYLRDNMVFSLEQRVQREHAYAIIDEVDSILIDEARTPLIISGPVGHDGDDSYQRFNRQVFELVRKQNAVVSKLIAEAEVLLADPKTRDEAGVKLYVAQLGGPKNKQLLRLLNETGVKQLVQRTELEAIADRKLPMRQQRLRDLEEALYFVLDERGHSVHLTDRGAAALSPQDPTLFLVPDISEAVHRIERDPSLDAQQRLQARQAVEAEYASKSEQLHVIHKLLQAHVLYEKDVEYIVQDGQVFIVDEFTGRIMPGRRWADGLHQAVEAKEGVQVKGETQTFATITIQNYFRMYDKLAGMTGTAETEETEFWTIYGLEVSVIPTNRPIARKDQPDKIYRTRKEKFDAIVAEIERLHQLRLPVLIGTVNVEVSEMLARQLKRRGLKHEVLNAKHHEREAEIVALAGQPGAITIATNMAGRGTDIKLGAGTPMTGEEAGLQVIGTERHESRRIDRQLRGRAGRQGDPGQTMFFLSLEDDLMRLFGSDRIAAWMDKTGAEEGEVITGGLITRAIEQAQKRVELQNFQARKRLLEYDDVMNQQREVVYGLRLFALEKGEQLRAEVQRMLGQALEHAVHQAVDGIPSPNEWDRGAIHTGLLMGFLVNCEAVLDPAATPDLRSLLEAVQAEGVATLDRKVAYLREFGAMIGAAGVDEQILSQIMLTVLDEKWKDHLYDLDQLRNAIHYRGWGQKDPLVEYKKEAFEMFEDLMRDINASVVERVLKVQIQAEPVAQPMPPAPGVLEERGPEEPETGFEEEKAALERGPSTDALFAGGAMARAVPVGPPPMPAARFVGPNGQPVVGRNEPCPCGSGKKFKKCHGASLF
jgi:preprotein translocase subunit SecA